MMRLFKPFALLPHTGTASRLGAVPFWGVSTADTPPPALLEYRSGAAMAIWNIYRHLSAEEQIIARI